MPRQSHTTTNTGHKTAIRQYCAVAVALASTMPGLALAQGPIEEITVYAQKREQGLQDVALAVSTLDGDDLDVLNIDDPFDFSDRIPGLVATEVQGYRRTFAIRGIGNEVPDNAATKPGVAYHIDGVFMSNDFALFQDLVDVERVEVIRGPDGTIYGNSSSGGAVNVITRRPETEQASGYLSGEIGSYNTQNLRGAFNLPLGETVAARFSASQRTRDGFTRNIPNPEASALNVTGAFDDLDDENNTSLGLQLLWQPVDRLSAQLNLYSFDMDVNGPALKGGFDTVSSDRRVVSHDTTEFFQVENEMASLILDWSTDVAEIRGLFSHQRYRMSRQLDADRSSLTANDPAPLTLPDSGEITLLGQLPIRQHVGGLTQRDETSTAEINIVSNTGGPLEWQGGAFYLTTDVESDTRNYVDNDRDGLPVNTRIIGFGNPDRDFQNSDTRSFESTAVFGQVRFALSDTVGLTAGARWTRNEFEDQRCNIFSGCLTNEGRTGTPATPNESNDNVTYKVALDWNWADDRLLYASIATGIKPAASNNGFVEDATGAGFFPEVFDEEEVTAWEVGSKNQFFDQRLQVNVSAYYYDIENYLFNSAGLNLTGNGVSGGSNLPESEVYGIELESIASLGERWRLDLSLAMADSEIKEGRPAIDRAEQVNRTAGLSDPALIEETIRSLAQDLDGNELPKIPDLVANARLSYRYPVALLGRSGDLLSTLSYTYRGDYYNRVFNSVRDEVPSYHLAHLNFRYLPTDAPWELALNIQNLFDEDEIASVHTDDFFQGVTSFQLLPPRIVTLSASYRF
ncbi:TonB-dependent receptor [Pseudohaliea rubra]|uniref:TonB-dependent receptor n=1 Tax=Pseudohaliea rubra DSM 19751 TaxID=1265313 RepID=A0A095VSK9_9GAMM|nr:TonB-dependent receptor [Pseudohaliea rubra]KGE04355.1 TonB-dependent receptor [Pseudohaliea rubra DSM 19751]